MKRPLLILNTTKENNDLKNIFLKHFPNALLEDNPDTIVSVGGDGTVLNSIKNEGYRDLPFFSIANGTLNFIPERFNDLDLFLEKLKNGETELKQEESFYIDISLVKPNNEIINYQGANDIVIGNGIMDFFHLLISSEDKTFDNYKLSAGGLCISTPLGSTAYNYNNKGFVIPLLDLPLFAISSIVSVRKQEINQTINANQKITISLNPDIENRTNCFVFIDGKTKIISLEKNEKLIIQRGKKNKFLFNDLEAFRIKRFRLR